MKNKKKSKNDKRELIDLIVKLVLVVIIIILFLHNCSLRKQNETKPISGGNINIIEIKCDTSNTCDPNNGGTGEGFKVYDGKIVWNGVAEAEIFKSPLYEINGTIAPEDSNIYQFIVKNGTSYKMKYSIKFIETNPYNANIKYKLKRNNTYVVDHYVSASEIVANFTNMASNDKDTFYLEWKWISSDNDTEIGKIENATYGLKIEIKAESIND